MLRRGCVWGEWGGTFLALCNGNSAITMITVGDPGWAKENPNVLCLFYFNLKCTYHQPMVAGQTSHLTHDGRTCAIFSALITMHYTITSLFERHGEREDHRCYMEDTRSCCNYWNAYLCRVTTNWVTVNRMWLSFKKLYNLFKKGKWKKLVSCRAGNLKRFGRCFVHVFQIMHSSAFGDEFRKSVGA